MNEQLCPSCSHSNPVGHRFCSQCGSSLPVAAQSPQPIPAAVSPAESTEKGGAFAKAVTAINNAILKHAGQDQYSFEYSWIADQCGLHGRLSRTFLKQLTDHYKAAGWRAWLYENQHDISGVAEDPALVLDSPDKQS